MENTCRAIALMSGTSLDGLDAAYVEFQELPGGSWHFRILTAETFPYSPRGADFLHRAIAFSEPRLRRLDALYGAWLGNRAAGFAQDHSIGRLDFIASHGHTVLHRPDQGRTLQIGSGEMLYRQFQKVWRHRAPVKVVSNFRQQDVSLGGQGAPLVPIGDRSLFSGYGACLNIGGFANISFLRQGRMTAFDICPANTLLNHFAQKLGKPYDEGGALAAAGNVSQELLDRLDRLPFYARKPPKSLGVEFNNESVYPLLEGFSDSEAIATLTFHIASQIKKVFKDYRLDAILATGGGAFNKHLVSLLQNEGHCVEVPGPLTVQFKEALIFGFMGMLRLQGRNNVLAAVTGALRDHSSGDVYPR